MNDVAVSPVVGTVLMIAIMLATVSALLAWGVPAIQDMERRSQFRSARSSFVVLDGVVDEILPEPGSSRHARVPTENGGLDHRPDADPFAIGWSFDGGEVTFDDLADDDAVLGFTTSLGVDDCRFTHFNASGTPDGVEVVSASVSGSSGTCTATRALNATHGVELRDSSDVALGEVWLFHPGRIRFVSTSAAGPFTLDYSNGAVASDRRGVEQLVDTPLLLQLEPEGMTVGVIDLSGSNGTAGGSRARVQATLTSSAVRADEETLRRVDLYPLGEMADAWLRDLDTNARYDLDHADGTDHLRYEPGGDLPLTVTHYIVETDVTGVG